ncbi:MAG: Uma2 family endonuclease [Caldilineaceae bacterium]|nr:Uma2 family endonuclease [Caldilineaceae bacterium]
MALALQREPLYTVDEYFALEAESDERNEYHAGQIYAMAGGSFNHEVINGNIFAALHRSAHSKGCIAFGSNMKIRMDTHDLYSYPDAMLICGKPQFQPNRTDVIVNPRLIVEVLSKSTESYDRGKKFEFYRSLPSFQEYLLVDQHRVQLELYYRVGIGHWDLTIVDQIDAVITLRTMDLELPVRAIYEQVEWLAG